MPTIAIRAVDLTGDVPEVVFEAQIAGHRGEVYQAMKEAKTALEKHCSCDLRKVPFAAHLPEPVWVLAYPWGKNGGEVGEVTGIIQSTEVNDDVRPGG